MILEAFFKILFGGVKGLINMLPSAFYAAISSIELPVIVKYGAYFFPLDCLVVAITSFITWYGILLTWAGIEWVYKKIPGVD